MNWHTCKSLLNTSGRAVEQLAGCLAKQAKVSSRGQSRTASAKLSCQYTRLKNIKNVKGCRDGMPKSMQTRKE